MIITQTPFRVSFFGGGTDYPDFFNQHGGAILGATINKYCYLSVHRLTELSPHGIIAHYAQTEKVNHRNELNHPLIRETLRFLNNEDRLEISHIADLPGRTGIGSSSSFTVGLLNALKTADPKTLAQNAIKIEREEVGDLGGHQDQYLAAYGGFLKIRFAQDSVEVERIESPRLDTLQANLLLFYTGIQKEANAVIRHQREALEKNEPALLDMKAMTHQAAAILSGTENLDGFGRLLHESWQLKKSLAKDVSTPDIDQAYEQALNAGALGGKLLGAGGRGFLLIYTNDPDKTRRTLAPLKEIPFTFNAEGSRIIFED